MSEDSDDRTRDELWTPEDTEPEEADRAASGGEETDGRTSGADGSRDQGARPMELARRASTQLAQLTGRKVEGVSGFGTADNGWRVTLDVVEVSRVPPTSDVLSVYEAIVDDDGDLLAYERVNRYVRGAVRRE